MTRRHRIVLVGFVVVVATVAAVWIIANRVGGRTPSTGFLHEAFPDAAVIFDRTYDGGGSSEDKVRIVALRTTESPAQVKSVLLAQGGWYRVGDGLAREDDGLCVVPYTTSEFVETHDERGGDLAAAVGQRPVVVLSLLYC